MTLLFPRPVFASNSGIFTISAWVKPETSVVNKAIVGKAEEVRVFTDGSGYVGCQFKSTTWQTAGASTAPLQLNIWSHVACTYDKITLRVYLNGVQVASTALTTSPDDTANALKYGIDDSASTPYSALKGTIDELKFYNYARTAKQVVEDMNGGSVIASGARQSPLAYWKFDEGFGTTTNNSGFGGTSLNGTLGAGTSAPTWSNDGKFGKALSFDGSNDYAYVNDSSGLDPTNNISVSVWVKPSTGNQSQYAKILDKKRGTECNNGYPYSLQYDVSTNIFFTVYTNTANSTPITGVTTTSNQWQHVVGTYDGTKVKIYINGQLKGETAATGSICTNTQILQIGGRDEQAAQYFTGLIDEVKIYNYALTQDEILTDYNAGSALVLGSLSTGNSNPAPNGAASQEYCIPGDTTTNCSPPVGRWDFNEGVGTSAFDTSGNGNNGALGAGSSAPTWDKGKVGKGLRFDGVNDYVTVPSSASLSPTNAITLSLWVNEKAVINYNLWLTKQTVNTGYYIGHDNPTTQLRFNVKGIGTINGANKWSTSDLNTWVNYVGTYSDSTGMRFYKNGKLAFYDASMIGTMTTESNALLIGVDYFGTLFINGLIDQVRIYNYARSPAQIAWDYNEGKPIAWYKFDECQGTTLNSQNETPNSTLNGTLNIGVGGTQTTVGTCTTPTDGTGSWYNGRTGKLNSSLNFDGTDDYVNIGVGQTVQSVSMWIKPTTNTTSLMQLAAGVGVTASSGRITATGFSSPTIYVNGIVSSTLTANVWQRVTITTATAIPASAIKFALFGTNYFTGQIDEVKLWNYPLTAVQVKTDYNQGAGIRFGL